VGIAGKHLSESQRAAIAKTLFKTAPGKSSGDEIHGYCPIHQESETSPSPSFSYNCEKDAYHCFSCGADGDLLKLWTEVHGLGQKEGFKAFCDQYGIPYGKDAPEGGQWGQSGGKDDRPDVELTLEQTLGVMRDAWDKFPSLPSDWITRLEKERGWSPEIVKKLDLRLQTLRLDKKTGNLKEIKKPEKIAIPIFDANGYLQNIRLYQPGAKQFKIISFAKLTGESRLFPPKPTDAQTIVLCEGESDTICALSHGYNAITQTSKLKNWPNSHKGPFRGHDVVIAYDADNAGRVYADWAGECLRGIASSLRVITWPDFMGVGPDGSVPKDHGQDLTDFFVRHGQTVDDFNSLIFSSKKWASLIPPAPQDDDERRFDGVYRFYDYGVNKRYSFRPRLLAEQLIQDMSLMYEPNTGLTYKWNGRFWDVLHEDYIKTACVRYLENEAQKSRVEDATFQARMLSMIPEGRKINDQDG